MGLFGSIKKAFKDVGSFTGIGSVFGGDLLGGLNTLAGDAMGWDAQEAANQANKDRYELALKLYDQGYQPLREGFQKQRGSLAESMGLIREGHGQALGQLQQMGQRGRQDARSQSTQTLGQTTQGMLNAGMGNSTRMAGLARGMASDTSRAVQSVNEGVSGASANLMADQGARLAQLETLIGNSRVGEAQSLNQWTGSKINMIKDRQDVAGPGWLPQVADVASAFIPFL